MDQAGEVVGHIVRVGGTSIAHWEDLAFSLRGRAMGGF